MTEIRPDAVRAVEEAARRDLTVATAESLTAGMVCAALADVPGASRILQGGIVAYQNSVKSSVLGVDPALLETAGSVDPRVAGSMAENVRKVLQADVGLATTGVAGPLPHDGQSVGTVFIAIAGPRGLHVDEHRYQGSRQQIRELTTAAALELLRRYVTSDDD